MPRGLHVAIAGVVWLAGCWASHVRGGVDAAPADDGTPRCSFSFRTAEGTSATCVIEREGAACSDAARCICLARTGGAMEPALTECIVGERTPRALVTLWDFCDRGLRLDAALAGYFRPDGPLHVEPRCAEIPARF